MHDFSGKSFPFTDLALVKVFKNCYTPKIDYSVVNLVVSLFELI